MIPLFKIFVRVFLSTAFMVDSDALIPNISSDFFKSILLTFLSIVFFVVLSLIVDRLFCWLSILMS